MGPIRHPNGSKSVAPPRRRVQVYKFGRIFRLTSNKAQPCGELLSRFTLLLPIPPAILQFGGFGPVLVSFWTNGLAGSMRKFSRELKARRQKRKSRAISVIAATTLGG